MADAKKKQKCWERYQMLKNKFPDTLRVIAKITKNDTTILDNLGEKHDLLEGVVCTTITDQENAYKQWQEDINSLWHKIEGISNPDPDMMVGGSQKGGADCPENFQKIFNYMFLFAASASIAVMSPDIELVTNVCMKALTLAFGTIVLPIINLLSVIFTFMLQSLVSIVKTAADVAIQIISKFIETVCVNIYKIKTGVIGIAKLFIYNTLTYCGSFYDKVVTNIATNVTLKQKIESNYNTNLTIPVIDSNIKTLTPIDEAKINESLKAAINEQFVYPEVYLKITPESDIFMDMLNKVGNTIDAIRNKIKFGHTFLKTAYLLLCDNTHRKLNILLGGEYYSNKAKLSLTKGLIIAENTVIQALNGVASFPEKLQNVIIYNFNVLCLKILNVVYGKHISRSERGRTKNIKPRSADESNTPERGRTKNIKPRSADESNTPERSRSRERDTDTDINEIVTILNSLKDTPLVFNLDFENPILPSNKKEVNDTIDSIKETVVKLTDNSEYVTIMMNDLDAKLTDNMNTPDVDSTQNVFKISEGGAKKKTPKRKTKKAKKRGNKRRYSRKP